jgi:3-oxoacyl-[acyl-carrier protein] reductase
MSKTALVTGATKGIGKAIAAKLIEDGWMVIATYSADSETAFRVRDEFDLLKPGTYLPLKADISTPEESINTIDLFLKENSIRLDALILNAGITDRSNFFSITPQNWLNVFAANLEFPVFLIQKIYPVINPGGSIIFTGSLMAVHPHSVSLAYGVSKSAVHALVKNLVKTFAPDKIRVNAVAPGFVDTGWHNTKTPELIDKINSKISLERFANTEEIASVYLMLLNNKYMNGEIIVCDGGYNYF